MRPINLIPPDERRGSQAPLRSGPLAYILVGALVLLLAGVTALVLTGNKVSEKESEVATLTSEDATAAAEAEKLTAYVTFQTTSEQRVATVESLANSRFDWERVMRELSLILPSNVWLVQLSASASGEVSTGGQHREPAGIDRRPRARARRMRDRPGRRRRLRPGAEGHRRRHPGRPRILRTRRRRRSDERRSHHRKHIGRKRLRLPDEIIHREVRNHGRIRRGPGGRTGRRRRRSWSGAGAVDATPGEHGIDRIDRIFRHQPNDLDRIERERRMKLEMTGTNRAIAAAVLVAVAAIAFWMMVLSPKREEAAKLGTEVENLQASLSQHETEVREGEEAKKGFADDYRQLVVLGKATPGDDETASLLVQLNTIAERSKVRFSNLKLEGSGESAKAEAAAPTGEEPATPTEAAASLMPLGAEIGPAGLAVMPYSLTFTGTFFQLADFIHGLDQMVATNSKAVTVDGRLVTINGFTLKADTNREFPMLEGEFSVTTFLTPPGEGLSSTGAPEAAGGSTEVAPVSTTTGGPAQ